MSDPVSRPEPELLDYEITDKAGPRVAGEIVGDRKILRLTIEAAEYELREGTIVLVPPKPSVAKVGDGKPSATPKAE